MELINNFIWREWCTSSKGTMVKVLNKLPVRKIRDIAEPMIGKLKGTKKEIINEILETLF